ncbi:MAG: ATP-dependent RecD-like DNA helicase [Kiritimatiellaeota bacterium]|nr:ATP-dependent RecD-like DNA helicase [Kiritimatiellota bacterium]
MAENGLTEQTLKGEVRRVVYASQDGAYSVLRVVDAKNKEQTVVGAIVGAYEGQGIDLKGKWETHKEHGRQLRVSEYKFTLPTTSEGIKRYLASGLIHGIGKEFAERIVNKFGSETLDILDNYSARLTEIPGFGKKRLEMVRKAWREHAKEREIFIFLQSLGVSLAYCRRIYKKYGEHTPAFVRADPYKLAEDIDGIGFIMSDNVAKSLGIEGTDPRRLRAGVVYTLNRLSESGHVCYPEEEFLKYTAELLNIDEKDSVTGLGEALKEGLAVIDAVSDDEGIPPRMVYKTQLHTAERELSHLIGKIAGAKRHRGEATQRIDYRPAVNLSDEQHTAISAVGHHPLNIITGGPGVGKTTVVGDIVRRASIAQLKVYLAAPTGRAAKRLSESCRRNASTIHRLLKWDPEKRKFVYNTQRPLKCDVLIIDEVSMLDVPLALFLFRAVSPGTTVVMVGDSDQLPSVGPGTVLMDLIMSGVAQVTHLSRIYRQDSQSRIITNAHAVNSGRLPDLTPVPKNVFSDFYWIEQENPERVISIIGEMAKERIPRRFKFDPMRDIQVLTPMNRGNCGTKTLNDALQEILNPETMRGPHLVFGEKKFRYGDRVMQIRNNYDKKVFNGDMGRIIHIDPKNKMFKVKFEDKIAEYEFVEADQIVLSYAVTVHKSQGSEFPVVIMPILTQHYIMLQRNLLYTGMTRAKKLMVLIGSRKALSMAVNNARMEPRFSQLRARLKELGRKF